MLPWYLIVWNLVKLLGVLLAATGIFALLGIALFGGSGASLLVCAVTGVVAGWAWFIWQLWWLSSEEDRRYQQQEERYWRRQQNS
jgi:hypothetical protein